MSVDIEAIQRRLLIKYPLFGSVLANTSFEEDINEKTASTDGEVIYYNPSFVNKLNDSEQTFLFAHEVSHIAFNHIFRSEGKNPKVWNIATDAVINAFLMKDGLSLEGVVNIPEAINYDADEMYEKLLEEEKNNPQNGDNQDNSQNNSSKNSSSNNSSNNNGDKSQNSSDGQSNSDNQEQNDNSDGKENNVGHDDHSLWKKAIEKKQQNNNKNSENKNNNEEKNNPENKDNQNNNSDNSSSNNSSNDSDDKSQSSDSSRNNSNKQNNESNKQNDDKSNKMKKDDIIDKLTKLGEKEVFKQNKIERKKQLEELRNALASQSHGFGNDTNGESRKISNIGISEPLIDWRMVLKESINLDVDWSYRNAQIEDGILTPYLEEMPYPETEIVLDTSGSINETLLRNFLRECKNILQTSKVKVGCFDTKFYGFTEIKNIYDIDKMEFKGGGGTNFDVAVNAFSMRVENKIIFTDGEANMPKKIVDAIWIVFGGKKISPKGGKVINISEEQLNKLRCEDTKGKSR